MPPTCGATSMPLTAVSVPMAVICGSHWSLRASSAEIVSTGLGAAMMNAGNHLRLEIEGIPGDRATQSAEEHNDKKKVNDAAQHGAS